MFDGDKRHVQVKIRHGRPKDTEMWERMGGDMWPDGREDHGPEIADFFAGMRAEPEAVLVAEGTDGHLMAVELSIRTNLPSRLGQPVGYVEGFFIVPETRGQGIARSLLQARREWAGQQGCRGFACDCAGRIVIDRTYENR